jgi:chemotaxis protein histidine kinase CheA
MRGGHWLMVVCGRWRVAIPTRVVRRLVLADTVRVLEAPPADGPGLLLVDGRAVAAWDLTRLVDGTGAPPNGPLVVLEDPDLPLGLVVDQCLSVGPIPAPIPLPPALGGAVVPLADAVGPPAALVLDPARLFDARRRAASRRVLA